MTAVSRSPSAADTVLDRVRAWDGATRLFHWTLVTLIVCAYVTYRYIQDPYLYLHRLTGYAVLTLLLFRLLWGFLGSSTSRFAAFFPWPAPAFRYLMALLRGKPLHYLGHNPLGGALILAMLVAVAAQACTGLYNATDDEFAEGPLHEHASAAVNAAAHTYHAKGFWIILAMVAVHITANLIYHFGFKDRLITSMVTGTKPAIDYVDQQQASVVPALRAVFCLVVAALVVGGGVMLCGSSLLR